ncbi:hypothetical protein K474DRAFT_1662116 [Panus rudis PR-1116 ss-1]|nr:hypothetical protein K474DRAFT_1662116 [Panus rudis PR-1116 ss-1]
MFQSILIILATELFFQLLHPSVSMFCYQPFLPLKENIASTSPSRTHLHITRTADPSAQSSSPGRISCNLLFQGHR